MATGDPRESSRLLEAMGFRTQVERRALVRTEVSSGNSSEYECTCSQGSGCDGGKTSYFKQVVFPQTEEGHLIRGISVSFCGDMELRIWLGEAGKRMGTWGGNLGFCSSCALWVCMEEKRETGEGTPKGRWGTQFLPSVVYSGCLWWCCKFWVNEYSPVSFT